MGRDPDDACVVVNMDCLSNWTPKQLVGFVTGKYVMDKGFVVALAECKVSGMPPEIKNAYVLAFY